MRISLDQSQERYGPIIDGVWRDEAQWCILFSVPKEIAPTWINSATGKPTTHIYINKDVAPLLEKALQNVIERGLINELKTFDGCFVIRDVRARPGHPSCHSYAGALDANALENKLDEAPTMSRDLVDCFTAAGFSWGGMFTRPDGMHFSALWE